MARFCFLPPTKRPTTAREQATKSRTRTRSSSMSDGMLKRLEPVFIPKKRLYKRGASGNNKTEATIESLKTEKHKEKNLNSEKQTPKKIPPKIQSQLPQRKSIRRELFPQNSKEQENQAVKNVLEIVDEQSKESNVTEEQYIFPSGTQIQQKSSSNIKHQDDEVTKEDAGFKKPKPKISKKRKQEKRLINRSLLEIIRKTHESIQKIRNQANKSDNITDESNKSIPENVHGQLRKTKTSLNVQVSICIPNAGIQKSQMKIVPHGESSLFLTPSALLCRLEVWKRKTLDTNITK